MSLEENKAIVRNVTEAFNKRNLGLLDEMMAPDFFDHHHQLQSLENFKKYLTVLLNTFPDYQETIEDIIAEGDKVWTRTTITGTHTSEFRGLSPTSKKFTITVVHNIRIVNSKIVERWSVVDMLDFYKQLGVIEYKGFPDEGT